LIRDEGFNLPIIGVAKAGWTLDHLKARAKDSLEHHGGIDDQMPSKSSWACCNTWTATTTIINTFTQLRSLLGQRSEAAPLSGHSAESLWNRRGESGQVRLRQPMLA
jgi:hypothetical protein